jgi:hypothetical protein
VGVSEVVYRGLAGLSIDARAALVASAIERFDPIDVETILDAAPAATRQALARARDRYLRLAASQSPGEAEAVPEQSMGELARRVQDVAARAFPSGEAPR